LNDCPNLKKLVVDLRSAVIGYYHPNNLLAFSCKKGPYQLVDVEIGRVRFSLSSDSFRKFVGACPNLEKVKFDSCKEIHLYHILYLLNHTNALKSIDICFYKYVSNVGAVNINEIEEVAGTSDSLNTSMKSLVLTNLNTPYAVFNGTLLLSVFKKCPMLEKVVVDFWEMEEETFYFVWRETIANNWQHLQSLTLQYAAWMMTNNELIMNALESCCGKGLKELSIYGKVTNALIARICQSFVALESLQLPFDNIQIQYPAMLQSFQQARFRNTLHTFKVPLVGRYSIAFNEAPFDYSDILNCFPALHTVDLMVTNALHVVEPFASIPQVKECTFRFSSYLMFSEMMMNMMKNFSYLKKLTLEALTLNSTVLSGMLTLPQLEHLIFHYVYVQVGTTYDVLLHPNQYPSIRLAPLKEFAYALYDTCYHFPQEHIRTFLQRFVSLERLIIRKNAVEDGELSELRQEFRYRTVIITA